MIDRERGGGRTPTGAWSESEFVAPFARFVENKTGNNSSYPYPKTPRLTTSPMLPNTTLMSQHAEKRLSPLQKRFVKEYPIDFNGAAAYLRASPNLDPAVKKDRLSAASQACKLLKMPKVKEAIEVYVKEALGPKEKHLLENVEFWIGIRDNPEAKISERLKASEMLAKYQQMFVERSHVEVEAQVQIVDDIS